MPNSKAETLFYEVKGYEAAIASKQELEKSGSDFLDQKGAVANTVAKLHPKRLNLRVSEIFEDTASTKTFRMVSTDGYLPPFQAGQYINVFVKIDGVETARPYCISSAPLSRDFYDLTIKRVDAGFVSHFWLDEVQVGDTMQSTGPMGTFYHNPLFHGPELVFLAGGSGIAPAITMIRDIADRNLPYRFHLIYASSYVDDVIFDEELAELDSQHEFLKIERVISRPPENYQGTTGHLNAEMLEQRIDFGVEHMFYICGPTPFNEFCREQLRSLGVAARRIRIECNGPPKQPNLEQNWPAEVPLQKTLTITVVGHGSFTAEAGEPLLNSLERNGYGAENACRSGECSLCRVKVVKGKVYNPIEAKLRSTDEEYGWCHSCVAFPLEDIEVML